MISVDIGLTNFAFVTATVDRSRIEITDVRRLDLRSIGHKRVPFSECTLKHGNCAADLLLHLFQEEPVFQDADVILVERQPPGGLKDYEQVVNAVYNSKVILVAPQTVHCFMGMRGLDYNQRKQKSIEISATALATFPAFKSDVRQHDMADAYCILRTVYDKWVFIWTHSPSSVPEKVSRDIASFFDSFRFCPSDSTKFET